MPDQPTRSNLATPAANAIILSPTQQRAFERARRAAITICSTFQDSYSPTFLQAPAIVPETAERLRLLIATMGIARGGGGGLAVAALAHRGYFVQVPPALSRRPPRMLPFDTPGFGGLGACLPTRRRPWQQMERLALAIPPDAMPQPRRIVSSHVAIRIRQELHRDGFSFDLPPPES